MSGDGTARGPSAMLLLTAEDVAERLGISTRTLWRMCRGGRCPQPLRLGGNTRWRSADIERWVAAGCPYETGSENGGSAPPGRKES